MAMLVQLHARLENALAMTSGCRWQWTDSPAALGTCGGEDWHVAGVLNDALRLMETTFAKPALSQRSIFRAQLRSRADSHYGRSDV